MALRESGVLVWVRLRFFNYGCKWALNVERDFSFYLGIEDIWKGIKDENGLL